eukprot:CAMPEP_0194092466 /NCGR_PEP_ID=MMETSP0149-20130528/46829_1 /TAXON_ID=122233 /ORGANISM="Chaetoceros debilis, Strain MM31A-1" /LENGTH=100 /DNA_ID=CAMNT_0038777417 /DNA_START=87 /DNA_END=386 /DNA_ORIENTATION=-
MMKYKDKNCDTLVNLALTDPPRWGWSANGGIVDVLTPHERARRTLGKKEYLARQDTVNVKRRNNVTSASASTCASTCASMPPVMVSTLAGLGVGASASVG